MSRYRVGVACAVAVLVTLHIPAAWATTKTCLTGTDPSVAADVMQIRAVRSLVDASCGCVDFDGTNGKTHAGYVKCATAIIKTQAALPFQSLRPQCVPTVKKVYADSTCGYDPALHVQPCVKKTQRGKVSCAIKPTTKSDGVTPTDSCVDGSTFTAVGCAGYAHCLDAADSNGDLLIDAGDSGACAPIGGARPAAVHVPPSYSPGTPMPLVVMLHGYGASGALEEAYLGLTALSDQRGFLYAYPDGTVDQTGARFWNATPACCNFFGSSVDDSAYVSSIITGMAARYTVDAKRVYIVGHSNGGFMAYRMACDHAEQIAAIASLAGTMFDDISSCSAASPVSVLHIHGTADDTILYNGSVIGANAYPGAVTTVADWVSIDGCTGAADLSAPALDLVNTLPGAETMVTQYGECAAESAVELWTMEGASHIPIFTPQFAPDVIDFLFAHPKP